MAKREEAASTPIVEEVDRIVKELEFLRKLAILDLCDRGFSQYDIADVLGVSQPTISRMFPKGIPKRRGAEA